MELRAETIVTTVLIVETDMVYIWKRQFTNSQSIGTNKFKYIEIELQNVQVHSCESPHLHDLRAKKYPKKTQTQWFLWFPCSNWSLISVWIIIQIVLGQINGNRKGFFVRKLGPKKKKRHIFVWMIHAH